MSSSLRELFTPLITYTLLFRRTPEEQQRPFIEIRAAFEKLLVLHKDAVKRNDIAPQDYEGGCFAIVAWIDEMILVGSIETNRELYNEWRRAPLQVALFNTANAGEEFFERLGRLTPAQRDLNELYYLALCLGFRGRYYEEASDPHLLELRRQSAAHLPVPALDLFEFEKRQEHLTPQPYEAKVPIAPPPSRPISRYWLAVPLVVAAAFLLYWLIPRGPDPKEIEDALRSLKCTQIKVVSIEHGVVHLSGHIESDEERDLLRQKLEAIRGVNGVHDNLKIIPRPFCTVMETLEPLRVANEGNGFQLEARPSKGCDLTYRNGERLVVEVTATKPLNYVYVDYYVADHEHVVHMFPNEQRPDAAVKDAHAITAGSDTDKSQWQVQEPYGLEMVTVISSPKPLLTPARPVSEDAVEYLALLHGVTPNTAGGMAANYCFIHTEP
jgi:type IV/VI secretion system ImpK/VasF family protein